jgi:outer membrane protein OmpA-like peptidoglycan-associated protein
MFQVYEAGQAGAVTTSCPPYQRAEVERSKTGQGHLPSDVFQRPQGGLVIADFGVGWRTPKPSLSRDPTLTKWVRDIIQTARTEPSLSIRISGYSDCVGQERNNSFLRRGRAERVRQLLQRLAGSNWRHLKKAKITVVAAPTGDYLAANATPEGRATNRGVLIEHSITLDFPPENVPRTPDTIQRICARGLELVKQQDQFGIRISVHQQKRIRCFLSRLCQPGFDDRYLTAQGVLDYNNQVYAQPYYATAKQWLLPDFAVRAGGPRPDQDIWRTLVRIDDDIIQGRGKINYYYATHGAATPRRVQQLRDWVANRENTQNSIYWCYGPNA